ncbi:MAG: hypothetical protein U9O96_03125 [Candidatus Thermoplasmatota archaeon]|nr:hypothetical protein [Candidatus Thermoplasmatota archaeon]
MNGMRKKILIVGVAMVAISAVVATQYARAELSYTYNINHPSNGFIRFVGGDNATDGMRVLRADGTNTTIQLDFGDLTAGINKTYTAAFAIVNEENFSVNITDIEVSTTSGADYLQIWLHGDPTAKAENDASSVFMWNKSTDVTPADATAWTLATGNSDPSNMDGTNIATGWDTTAQVRYTEDTTAAASGSDDYVWVQISIDIPSSPDNLNAHTGTITFDFEATTH